MGTSGSAHAANVLNQRLPGWDLLSLRLWIVSISAHQHPVRVASYICGIFLYCTRDPRGLRITRSQRMECTQAFTAGTEGPRLLWLGLVPSWTFTHLECLLMCLLAVHTAPIRLIARWAYL